MSNQALAGKVMIVTGGGRGIGREISLAAAAAGASVVVNDIGTAMDGSATTESPGQETVSAIKAAGGNAIHDTHSVADPSAAQAIVEGAIQAFGRIDSVVHSAGILRDKMVWNMSYDDWDSVVKVHLYGAYNISRAAVPHFREQKSGSVVLMTSTSGLIGNIGQANYAAAKMGMVGLSRSLALELARSNVRSNCISPFAITRMMESIPRPDKEEWLARRAPMSAARVAPLAVFLSSDAAQTVTGQIFAVRGNEIFLMSQPRPLRGVHRSDGWTQESLASQFLPSVKANLYPLEGSAEVFSWDAI